MPEKSSRDFSLPPCFLIILSINFVQIPVSACIELYNIFIQFLRSVIGLIRGMLYASFLVHYYNRIMYKILAYQIAPFLSSDNEFWQSTFSSPYIFSALLSDTHTAAVSLLLQNALPETVPDCFHNLTLPPQTVRSSDRIRSRPPHYNNDNFLRLLRFHIPFPQKYPVPETP